MKPHRILVVDDDAEILSFFTFLLAAPQYQVVTAGDGAAVERALQTGPFDLAMVDLKLPDTTGIAVLSDIRSRDPRCRVVIMTGYSTVKSAVQAVQLGAYDYIEKPFADLADLERLIERALGNARAPQKEHPSLQAALEAGLVVGSDLRMARLVDLAYVIAQKPTTVLILGETGTGKEVMARFVHRCSQRADRPFLAVNCAALAETLLESELFGHEKGAFTGAASTRRGIFELAGGGTLFLDEIGEASPSAQAKLLRLLETGTFQRVGGEQTLRADVRIIAATNAPLEQAVRQGTFRADLFYRLDVVTLTLPPLRERMADLPALVDHFLHMQGMSHRGRPYSIAPEAAAALERYPWPGNLRELNNVLLRAATISPDGHILPEHLPEKLSPDRSRSPGPAPQPVRPSPADDLTELLTAWIARNAGARSTLGELLDQLRDAERQAVRGHILNKLRETLGNRQEAARLLGATPRMIKYYLNERGDDGSVG